jgi:RNA polymerase sigma-70 factor (ECF subfamily)
MIVSLRSGRTTRATLLGRIRDGVDTAAWRELDGVYREMLLRFCRSRGLQHADAEDVIQLVFVKLTVGLQRFEYDRTRGRFRDYLFRCVRSALSDWAACQSRAGSAVSLLEADRPDGRADIGRALEQEWVDHHYRHAVDEVLRTAESRSANILRATLAGRSVRDIARELGMADMAVYKVQQRMRDRLRARIAAQVAAEEEQCGR